jgi:hypothetical protein
VDERIGNKSEREEEKECRREGNEMRMKEER